MQVEPIAVIGMGCRFPKAPDPEAFWELLEAGGDAITEVPPDRWDAASLYSPNPRTPGKMCTRWGGFLEDVDAFDPIFFKIMPLEAGRIDPQHRLVLEVAWEALESAALDPFRLAYSSTGVFIGISHCDHSQILYRDRARIDGYNGPHTYYCFAANRLSYFLNLQGPSMAVDTACSSSLAAIHLACQSLRCGETNLALAGGVNLNLTPEEFIALSFLGVLSPDRQSRTFDARAAGYLRGEGCGIVVLKRLSDAIEARDPLLAIIRGSAVNHNGLSNGITAPNGAAQEEVLNRALKVSGVDPIDVSCVEVMGTATAIGDPIELAALKAVYLKNRQPWQTCCLSSVKSNIGHLEAASGAASLIKVILSMRHGQIPAQLHYGEPNPGLRLEGTPLVIPRQNFPWSGSSGRRLAGISAFGFGGSNAHLILEEPPVTDIRMSTEGPQILTLSGRSERALRDLAGRYVAFLRKQPAIDLGDVCYTANAGRAHFDHRLAVVSEDIQQLRSQLESFISNGEAQGLKTGKGSRRAIAVRVTAAGRTLEDLAHQYVSGSTIEWATDYARHSLPRVQLPTYPFQRQRCRFE